MLFRPLAEIRIAGIRLPFTPGILPRQREKLADSIGAMVERELLTPAVVAERLNRADTRQKIAGAADGFIGGKAEEWYPDAVSGLLVNLDKPEVRRQIESRGRLLVKKALDSFSPMQRFFVTVGGYDTALDEKMPEIIAEFLRSLDGLLRQDSLKEKIVALLRRLLSEKIETVEVTEAQTAELLSSVDVRALVRDRINSLDMLRVEKIVLDVMADQFQWINIFGAILGALIGGAQVLLSLFF
jgi:uncharacterized membrane protein YheB (UPF0754 family)